MTMCILEQSHIFHIVNELRLADLAGAILDSDATTDCNIGRAETVLPVTANVGRVR